MIIYNLLSSISGHAVAQLVEALRYKPQGRGIESRWGGFFQFTQSFQLHYGPGINSASNRNMRKADNLTAICEQIV
jgi:hypothetical protein